METTDRPKPKRGRPRKIPIEQLEQYKREYMQQYNKTYYDSKREAILDKKRQYYVDNRDQVLQRAKDRYEKLHYPEDNVQPVNEQ